MKPRENMLLIELTKQGLRSSFFKVGISMITLKILDWAVTGLKILNQAQRDLRGSWSKSKSIQMEFSGSKPKGLMTVKFSQWR